MILILLLGQVGSVVGVAAATSGSVTVHVADQSGSSISNAKVILYNSNWHSVGKQYTGRSGDTTFSGYATGKYHFSVYKSGQYWGSGIVNIGNRQSTKYFSRSEPYTAGVTTKDKTTGSSSYHTRDTINIAPKVYNPHSFSRKVKVKILVDTNGDGSANIVKTRGPLTISSGSSEWYGYDYTPSSPGTKRIRIKVLTYINNHWTHTGDTGWSKSFAVHSNKGSAGITVSNQHGYHASGVKTILYDGNWNQIGSKTTNSNGAVSWSGLTPGTYHYSAYNNGDFWGSKTINIQKGQTTRSSFTRHEPYQSGTSILNARNQNGPYHVGKSLRLKTHVRNDGNINRKVRVVYHIDTNGDGKSDKTLTASSKTVDGGSTTTFSTAFTPHTAGRKSVRVTTDAYISGHWQTTDHTGWIKTFSIQSNKATVSVTVDKAGPSNGGIIQNANVFVDGTKRGTTNTNGKLTVAVKTPGTHSITVQKNGFQSTTTTKTIGTKHANVTIDLKSKTQVAATITNFHISTTSPTVGDTIHATASVKNTGDLKHTFFVGFSAIGASGTKYDNGGSTGKAITLAPGDSTTVALSWNSTHSPSGTYSFVSAVWKESNPTTLKTRLDKAKQTNAIHLAAPTGTQATVLSTTLPAKSNGSIVSFTGRLSVAGTQRGISWKTVTLRDASTNSVLATAKTESDGSFALNWNTNGYSGDSKSLKVYLSFTGSDHYSSSTTLKNTPYPVRIAPNVQPFDFTLSTVENRTVVTEGNTTKIHAYAVQKGKSFVVKSPVKYNMPRVSFSVSGIPTSAYSTPDSRRLYTSIGLPPVFGTKSWSTAGSIQIDTSQLSPGKHVVEIHATSNSGKINRTRSVTIYVAHSTPQGAERILNNQMVKTTSPAWWKRSSITTLLTNAKMNAVKYSLKTSRKMIKAALEVRPKKVIEETIKTLYDIYVKVLAPTKTAQQQRKVGVYLAQSAQRANVNVDTFHQKLRAGYRASTSGHPQAAVRNTSRALLMTGAWKSQLQLMKTSSDMPPWKQSSKSLALQQIETTQGYLEARLETELGTNRSGLRAWYDYSPARATTRNTIHFGAYGSADSNGQITSYNWQFGDGATGTGKYVSHSYDKPGRYTVTLTVTNATGETDSMTRHVYVSKSVIAKNWQFKTGGKIHTSPTVAHGLVYVGSDNGKLYALSAASGNKQWSYNGSSPIKSSPTVSGNNVYFGSGISTPLTHFFHRNQLHAVNANTGASRWSYKLSPYEVDSSPAAAAGTVYIGSGDLSYHGLLPGINGVSAVNSSTGKKRWQFVTNRPVSSSPTVSSRTVYVGTNGGKLYALDAQTGAKKWVFTAGGGIKTKSAVVNGTVYIGSNDGKLYAVNAQTGHKQWEFQTNGSIDSSPSVAGGTVYTGSNDGKLYAVNAQTGHKQWAFSTAGAVTSSPTLANGMVYVGSNDQYLYAIDASTGTKRWSYRANGPIQSAPAVVNSTIYVASTKGSLYAIKKTNTQPSNHPPKANDMHVSTTQGTSVMRGFNASDPNGNLLTYHIVQQPTHGNVSVSGGHFTYTPDTRYAGSDSFTYKVSDGNGRSDTAKVTLDINNQHSNLTGIEPSVSVSGGSTHPGGTVTVSASVQNAQTLKLSGLPSRWSIADKTTNGATFHNGGSYVGWVWGNNQSSATVSVTFNISANAVTTTQKLTTVAENSNGNTNTTNTTVTVSKNVVSQYDTNGKPGIQIGELNNAINNYFTGNLTIQQLNKVINAYFRQA